MPEYTYELTNSQKSIWLTEEFFQGTNINHISGNILIQEKVDLLLLGKALNLYVQKNEAIRLRLCLKQGQVKQYIEPYHPFTVPVCFLQSEADLEKWNQKIIQPLFSLMDSDLFRFTLIQFSNGFGGLNVTFHHILSDAWTMSLFINEVMSIYHQLLQGETVDTSLNPSYIDYISATSSYQTSSKFQKDAEFWKQEFSNEPQYSPILPTAKKEADFRSEAKRKEFVLPKSLVSSLQDFCRTNGISLYALFMSIFSIYLAKLNSIDRPIMGTPILNRSNRKDKQTAGMFISTIPFQAKVDSSLPFLDFVKQISTKQLSLFRHQKYPYDVILENIKQQYDFKQDLYDVAFSFQNARDASENFAIPYHTQWLFNGHISNTLEIHAYDMDNTGEMQLFYDYQVQFLDEKAIESLHQRILHILSQVLEDPRKTISQIELITKHETDFILDTLNATTKSYDKNQSVMDILANHAKNVPNKPAVIFEKQTLTYQELHKKSNQLANFLTTQSFQSNDVVAILLDRGIDLITTILAVLKTGAAYLLIDPSLPQDRVFYMLENCEAKALLTTSSFDFTAPCPIICLDKEAIHLASLQDLTQTDNPEDTFCVLYTSGSTGKPKGVALKRGSILNLVLSYQTILHTKDCDSFLGISTVAFDMFIVETFVSLLSGSTLVLANEEEQKVPVFMKDLIIEHHVDFILSTPSKMTLLLSDPASQSCLENVKVIQLGGEVFTPDLFSQLQTHTQAHIFNGYGPSEATACTSNKQLNSQDPITIGTPICNAKVLICNTDGNLLPIGYKGEICIAGDGVAKGYINRPDLTKKAFVPNPFGSGLLYKTGDIGKWNEKGEIDYIGRSDFQVKLRGLRIELDEITAKIKQIPAVQNAVSVIQKVNQMDCICSYIVADHSLTEEQIKQILQKSLPYYMVPSHIVWMESLPLTLNGKIDLRKLPEISIVEKPYIAPQNSMQQALEAIWKQLLHLEKISMDSNFFELGGDSLCSIRLVSEIYSTFHKKITVKDIFTYPTIASLASFLDTLSSETEGLCIPKAEKRDYYPLSSAQKRIYYTIQMEGENSVTYNTPGGIMIKGNLDIAKLEKCLQTLIQKHASFRTHFVMQGTELVQIIDEMIPFSLEVEENTQEISTLIHDFVHPFDLSKAPLFRIKLMKQATNSFILLFDMHHIICDGTSISIFLKELSNLYNNTVLDSAKIDYPDYTMWEIYQQSLDSFKDAENYWLERFSGELPSLTMPHMQNISMEDIGVGRKITQQIDQTLYQKIEHFCKVHQATPYMFLLTCYYVLLYKYTGQSDLIVGTPTTGRNHQDLTNIIGMFVSTLALRNTITPSDDFLTCFHKIVKNCSTDFTYESYPFDELIKKLPIERNEQQNPLFDTMFIYQNYEKHLLHLNELDIDYALTDTQTSKFDFSLEISPMEDSYDLSLEYKNSLFTENFMNRFLKHYCYIVDTVLEEPNSKISDISVLSPNEKKQILEDFNPTACPYDSTTPLQKQFEEQVNKHPQKTAIVFDQKKISYQELNEKANQLAHYLKKFSIGENQVVGIMMTRSYELEIAMLGILKTGAAYFLIDPSLPEDRIIYMLKDCQAPFILTKKEESFSLDYPSVFIEDAFSPDFRTENLHLPTSNESLFCVIYTSGSTGKPKGVALKRLGILNMVLSYKQILQTNICENFLCMSAVSFDMFIVENLVPLLSGKTIILCTEEQQKIPVYTNQLITTENVHFVLTTPSRIDLLLTHDQSHSLAHLKKVQLGGEVFTKELYEKLRASTSADLYNGYGPSEITACCSNKKVDSKENITIGTPFCNTKVLICDKDMNLCPIHVSGQICVVGDGVSKGYLNNTPATQKVFIPNPFGYGTLYQTGDIGKLNENGEIEYIGRQDSQIKIRGLRIELSEIENRILEFSGIEKCCVLYKKEQSDNFIVGFYTASSDFPIHTLRDYLAKKLPLYMVPKYFVQLDTLPMNLNGKVDKQKLYQYPIEKTSELTYTKPETDTQKMMCKILEDLLQTQVGIDQDIFELGADSLLAIKFKVELLSQNIELPYAHIFKYKTVKEMADHISYTEKQSLDTYDYTAINHLLSHNQITYKQNIIPKKSNRCLLLGSNGFVGMHLLASFLKQDDGPIYCMVREKNHVSAYHRFLQTLHFYFGTDFDEYLQKRIFVVSGLAIEENFGLDTNSVKDLAGKIDIVINTASMVKHYGDDEEFIKVNVKSTQNLVNFCKTYHKRLLHISSLSVSGNMSLDGDFDSREKQSTQESMNFSESNLYIGQCLDNIYIRSKFEAEKVILQSITKKEIEAQIFRLGNITNRYSDGKFQLNVQDNAFVNRLKTFLNIKVLPASLRNSYLEFTPVDVCGDCMIQLMQHYCSAFSVFHVYNPNHLLIQDFIAMLKKQQLTLEILEEKDFNHFITELLQDPSQKELLSGIINDLGPNKTLKYDSNIHILSEFTRAFLHTIGFKWPPIDEIYIKKYMDYLNSIHYIQGGN